MEKEIIICNIADDDIFIRQCAAIEKKYKGHITDKSTLEDVDGSIRTILSMGERTVKISNDKVSDAVYVNANFDIERDFKK